MNKEQQELFDEAYKNYLNRIDDKFREEDAKMDAFRNAMNNAKIDYTVEEFINKCKTDSEFSEKWRLKIEERELRLEERLEIADKFNPLIREDCLTKTHHPDETEELKLIYRHAWLDSLGPNVVPQRKLITITYNDKTIES
jgi:hypothetical protein